MSKWRLTLELTVQGASSRRSSIQRRPEPPPCPGTSAPNAVDPVCAVESVHRIAVLQAIGASPYACQIFDDKVIYCCYTDLQYGVARYGNSRRGQIAGRPVAAR
jgi:hypothetical protein